LQGVFERLEERGEKPPAPVGLQIMVHGTVPTGGVRGVWQGEVRVGVQGGAGKRVGLPASLPTPLPAVMWLGCHSFALPATNLCVGLPA